jgi:hypothetical protein
MLHNGGFTGLNRRLSRLARRFGPVPEGADDDPLGDDAERSDEEERRA